MKKIKSNILIALACASILSISVGVSSVKADVQGSVKQTHLLKQTELQDAIFKPDHDNVILFRGDNLRYGYITNKTTHLAIQIDDYLTEANDFYVLKNSSGTIVHNFYVKRLEGQKLDIPSLKVGETYTISSVLGTEYSSFHFTVIPSEEVGTPTINKVTSQAKSVSGTGVAGATVNLTIAGESYTGTVDASGKYKIPLNKKYALNSAIIVYQEKDGIKSDDVTASVVAPNKIAAPKLNQVTTSSQKISGTGIAGATLYVKIGGDNYKVKVNKNGQFSILMGKTYPAKTNVTAYQVKNQIKSSKVTASVVATAQLDIPSLNKVSENDTTVTGKATPGATVRLIINGSNFHTQVSSNGQFSINLTKSYPVNTEIEAYQEINGVKSETTTVYVQLSANLSVDKVTTDSTIISGTALPNAKITVQIGDQDFSGKADLSGHFKIDLQSFSSMPGTEVTVTAKSSDGTKSQLVKVNPKKPVIGLSYVGDNYIRGVVDPGATVTIMVGTTKYQTTANSKGNFNQSVDPSLLVGGTLVSVYSTSGGLDSETATENVNQNRL